MVAGGVCSPVKGEDLEIRSSLTSKRYDFSEINEFSDINDTNVFHV